MKMHANLSSQNINDLKLSRQRELFLFGLYSHAIFPKIFCLYSFSFCMKKSVTETLIVRGDENEHKTNDDLFYDSTLFYKRM